MMMVIIVSCTLSSSVSHLVTVVAVVAVYESIVNSRTFSYPTHKGTERGIDLSKGEREHHQINHHPKWAREGELLCLVHSPLNSAHHTTTATATAAGNKS